MVDLDIQVDHVEAVPHSVAPLLVFKLRIRQVGKNPMPIHSVNLHCQIRLEPARRRYKPQEQERLLDIFGEPPRWSQTLRPMLWTHADANVGSFSETTVVDLPVPCTFDFNVAATKYFQALDDGEAPLSLLFSGTVFYEGSHGGLQIAQIPWDKDACFRLPIMAWKEMMDRYYPNTAWLCLRRDTFDQLYQYKRERGLATWEQTLESLLSTAEAIRR